MRLRPENARSPLQVAIVINGSVISTGLPERDERFRATLLKLGYAWYAPQWKRRIDERFHGTVLDRAIELAHTLLSAGFPIDIEDIPVERIVAGDYEPEHTRWVRGRLEAPYRGWFVLAWPREDDFYHRARRLHGSLYHPPHVVVPPDSYLEVLDFAEAHGFRLSPGAQDIVTEARARYEAAVMVVPQRKHAQAVPPPPPPPGAIAPDLRDDDMDDHN